MAKTFSEINVKAAAITGAILGFLCWLLVIPYSYSGYGLMGYMMGYGPYYVNGTYMSHMMGYGSNVVYSATYMMDIFHNYSPLTILLDVALGALAGTAIGVVYNWALKLK